MMNKVPLTKIGAEMLREELKRLKGIERPNVIKAIAEARGHGDLSENAEYHAAKEQQSFIEGRIALLEQKLSIAMIIDPTTLSVEGRIVFGATIKLFHQQKEQEVSYQIVGELEADVDSGKLSIASPIARGLIGKEVGDLVEITVPGGTHHYEILEVLYI